MTTQFVAPGQHLQRLQRALREYTDQHGRHFEAWAELATNQPVEELRPLGFQPPWLPPMRFAKWRRNGDLTFKWDYDAMANELAEGTQSYYQEAIMFALENNKPEPEIGGPVHPTIRFAKGKPPLSPAIPLYAKEGEPWLLGVPGAAKHEVLEEVLHQGIGSNNRAALEIIRKAVQGRMADVAGRVATVAQPEPMTPKVRTIHDMDTTDVAALAQLTYREFVSQVSAAAKKKGEPITMGEISVLWKEHKSLMAEAV